MQFNFGDALVAMNPSADLNAQIQLCQLLEANYPESVRSIFVINGMYAKNKIHSCR